MSDEFAESQDQPTTTPADGETREYGDGRRWRVTYRAPDTGSPMPASCPECGRFMGTLGQYGKARLFCPPCQSEYWVEGDGKGGFTARLTRRVAVLEDTARKEGLPTLGEALRGEMHSDGSAWGLLHHRVVLSFIVVAALVGAFLMTGFWEWLANAPLNMQLVVSSLVVLMTFSVWLASLGFFSRN